VNNVCVDVEAFATDAERQSRHSQRSAVGVRDG